MDYVTRINEALRCELASKDSTVVYGQNVNAGSRLGGLAKDFTSVPGCRVINTPNTENSLVGMGFGLMLSGVPSMYVMKQQDFVLLGVDHLVNTWNALRSRGPFVPFVMAMIVVDSGWEGPQSSFNNTGGLSALSRIPAYQPTGAAEIPLAIAGAFVGGPAILAVSQRMFRTTPISGGDEVVVESFESYVVYRPVEAGSQTAVVIARNFSLQQAWELCDAVPDEVLGVTVVSYFKYERIPDQVIVGLCQTADRVIIVDDDKSSPDGLDPFELELIRQIPGLTVSSLTRNDAERWMYPNEDLPAWGSEVWLDIKMDANVHR